MRAERGHPPKRRILIARRHRIALGRSTKIMGILNVTPDSFSGDGLLREEEDVRAKVLDRARAMVRAGAHILDVGGESTRPGARMLPVREEMRRVVPLIRLLAGRIRRPVSVDSYKPEVAEEALKAGASIVNTIMGTPVDPRLLKTVRRHKAAVVLMHIRGTPRTMQKDIRYTDVVAEIIEELGKSIEKCLEIGITSDRIVIDPGIGFGKTAGHNLEILRRLGEFSVLGLPVLIGPSRKSFIGKVLRKPPPERLPGTLAAVCAGVLNGAAIVRVHDVQEAADAVKMIEAIRHPGRFMAEKG